MDTLKRFVLYTTLAYDHPCLHTPNNYIIPETEDHQFENFVVTDGTVSCPKDNLQWHQWRQIYKIAIFCFQWLDNTAHTQCNNNNP